MIFFSSMCYFHDIWCFSLMSLWLSPDLDKNHQNIRSITLVWPVQDQVQCLIKDTKYSWKQQQHPMNIPLSPPKSPGIAKQGHVILPTPITKFRQSKLDPITFYVINQESNKTSSKNSQTSCSVTLPRETKSLLSSAALTVGSKAWLAHRIL